LYYKEKKAGELLIDCKYLQNSRPSENVKSKTELKNPIING
jgi:hypothetical protein